MTSTVNRFSSFYQNTTPRKMAFWQGVNDGPKKTEDPTNNGFSEEELDYNSQEEDDIYQPSSFTNKRKAVSVLEPTIDHIKRIALGNEAMTARVKAFYDTLLEEKRKEIGDVLCWQEADDDANKSALLDGNINVIMQARGALMSKDDEGITIHIEQAGWEDASHIRPKYAITIKRVTGLSE
jgi:hypothetical protein